MEQKNKHISVLTNEVLKLLDPDMGDSYLDLTAGFGGHAKAIIKRTANPKAATLVDRDIEAIASLQAQTEFKGSTILNQDFVSACQQLINQGKSFDMILADLGVSSLHLDDHKRGFSFLRDGPLDMRMDQNQVLTAADIVNKYDEAHLVQILKEYGDEPKAKKIAKLIIDNRPFYSTTSLARVVARAWPGFSRTNPATRSFQAIRMAVNDESRQISDMLPLAVKLLKPGGRIVVISFHSLEDRIVKQFFQDSSGGRYDAQLKLLTKKPVEAEPSEVAINPRARSAKLRAAVKQK